MVKTSKMVSIEQQIELAVTIHESASPCREAILFCPGLGGTQAGFADDAEFFAQQGYYCITLDLRGFGQSSRPFDLTPESVSLKRLALDIIGFLETEQSRPVHFVGHSLGGVVGLEIVRLRPSALSSLVTFGTTYHLQMPGWMVAIQNTASHLLGQKALANLAARASTKNQRTRKIVREMFLDFPLDIGRLVRANIAQYDYRSVAAQWNRPILLLTGDQDREINQRLKSTLAALSDRPCFHHQTIPNAGHFTNLDNPESFRQAITSTL